MFKNYLVITLRNILKNKLYALLNIGGFAIGLAACFLVLVHVTDELSYDKWIPEGDRIFRVESTTNVPGRAPKPVAQAMGIARDFLVQDFPEIVSAVRLVGNGATIRAGENIFAEATMEVDPNFFDLFPLEMVRGDHASAFSEVNSILLSEERARAYFGDINPIGQVIEYENGTTGETESLKVTGVFQDLPDQTHLNFDILVRFNPEKYIEFPAIAGTWFFRNTYLYFKLAPGADIEAVRAKTPAFIDRHIDITQISVLSGLKANEFMQLDLVAVPDIYLNSVTQQQMRPVGSMGRVWAFSGVAALILLIASINFVNLTTAQATQRAREVGLRKVMGASRKTLATQFLGEALAITSLAFLLSLVIVELVVPEFAEMLGKPLQFGFLPDAGIIGIFALITVFVGILSGLYPALIMSSYKPGKVLHSNRSQAHGGMSLRNGLVIFQFAISVSLIAANLIIGQQLDLAGSAKLGYKQDNLLVVRGMDEGRETLKTELLRNPNILAVTTSSNAPTDESEAQLTVLVQAEEGEISRAISRVVVDTNFFDVMNINLLAGKTFRENSREDLYDPETPGTPTNVILNESGLKLLGFGGAEEALGNEFKTPRGSVFKVVGVIPDLYYRSVRTEVRPTFYMYFPNNLSTMIVSYRPEAAAEIMSQVEQEWVAQFPRTPFFAQTIQELFEETYTAENQQRELLLWGSVLGILVATLGIFGLALFTIERRYKEIAIRKVLGARVVDILGLMTWQFSKPVILANLIAWPVAWFVMNDWLSNFVFRIDINIFHFITAGAIALLIAWVTVASHVLRIANTKPIGALSYE